MAGEVEKLNRFLDTRGQDIKLRRTVGETKTEVDCRAHVRGFSANELVGGITQQDSFVILSPAEIIAASWPGGAALPNGQDARIPSKDKGDKACIAGKWRTIEAAVGLYKAGELVRIEMRVLG